MAQKVRMDKQISKTLDEFFRKFTILKYRKGEILVRSDDTPSGVMYLARGHVRQYAINQEGDMLVLHVFKPGSFFPMTWAINNTPNAYFYEAVTPAEIFRAPREEVVAFLKVHPEILFNLTSRLLEGLSGLLARIEHLILDPAYVKTVSFLLFYAKTFAQGSKEGVAFTVPVTHRELAAWIGTTRETASLQVEALKKKGLVHYKGRQLIIANLALLSRELDAAES